MNNVIHGNCLVELSQLPSESIDLIFADPPYWMRVEGILKRPEGTDFQGCNDEWDNIFQSNEDYNKFTKQWLLECKRVLKPNGSIWVIGGMQCIYSIGSIMQELDFWFINDVIWQKSNPTPNFLGTRLNNSHETLIWATKSSKSKYTFNYKTAKELNIDVIGYEKGERRQLGSIWKLPICSGNERLKNDRGEKLHSTQKPEQLLYRIIAISSKYNDVVLDPFGGTLTTAAMAKRLGRQYITIEQNEEYLKYGLKRLDGIDFEDTKIARAEYDIKPKKVSLKEMIELGYFFENENFYLKNTLVTAQLLKNGKLFYANNEIDMHSLAAKLKSVKSERINGFNFWEVEREGKRVSINTIREKFRIENP